MTKVSPVKEKAIRLTAYIENAQENQLISVFGVKPSIEMIANQLGYSEDRLRTIMHGDCHMSSIDKVAVQIASWISDGSLNSDYVTKGAKNMNSKNKSTGNTVSVDDEKQDNVLPIVDMDDELDELDSLPECSDNDDDLEDLPEIQDDEDVEVVEDAEEGVGFAFDKERQFESGNKVVEIKSADDSVPVTVTAIKMADAAINKSDKTPVKAAIKTAKDYWIDAAIDLGISADALNDHFMQLFSTKDGKLHLFKEPEGALPYRQEIFDIQAVGLGKPTTINYADDKVKYSVHYAVVYEGELELDVSDENEAYAKLFKMFDNTKFAVSGHTFKFNNLAADINPVIKD